MWRGWSSTESQRLDDVVLERWFARGRTTHLYWIDEPDYLVLASVPQALMDRMNATERVSIADWLVRNEGGPIANSAALLSLRMDNIPRLSYHYMLQGLQILSDLSSADIDLFTLPSAGELELPPDGALGWRLELGAERIAVQMSYDGTPLDLLGSQGGFAAVAALGIVAAVTIPAYQDYTVRARV